MQVLKCTFSYCVLLDASMINKMTSYFNYYFTPEALMTDCADEVLVYLSIFLSIYLNGFHDLPYR